MDFDSWAVLVLRHTVTSMATLDISERVVPNARHKGFEIIGCHLLLKELVNLFQRAVFCLGDEEVVPDEADDVGASKDVAVFSAL